MTELSTLARLSNGGPQYYIRCLVPHTKKIWKPGSPVDDPSRREPLSILVWCATTENSKHGETARKPIRSRAGMLTGSPTVEVERRGRWSQKSNDWQGVDRMRCSAKLVRLAYVRGLNPNLISPHHCLRHTEAHLPVRADCGCHGPEPPSCRSLLRNLPQRLPFGHSVSHVLLRLPEPLPPFQCASPTHEA